MAFKDAVGQVIELLPTRLTAIPLPLFLPSVLAPLSHLSRPTLRTAYPFRPAEFSHFGVAFLIVNQVLDVEHCFALFVFVSRLAYRPVPPFANQILAFPIEPSFFVQIHL